MVILREPLSPLVRSVRQYPPIPTNTPSEIAPIPLLHDGAKEEMMSRVANVLESVHGIFMASVL